MSGQGSSPLTRGKPCDYSLSALAGRLIPAHAGKTLITRNRVECIRAHPRSRGENILHCVLIFQGVGSSPLTRGKPPRVLAYPHRDGLIPAHAGKTGTLAGPSTAVAAHPRSRGENMRAVPGIWIDGGSSPLTRGKPGSLCPEITPPRLIPAHAGKTFRGGV